MVHRNNDVRRTGGFLPVLPRLAIVLCLLMLATGLTPSESRADMVVVDAAGRTVHLEAPARRIVLNDSLVLLSLALFFWTGRKMPIAPLQK